MAYTTIDDPSAHFQTLLYTGNSSSPRDLVNDGNSDLQPDLVWVKGRSHADIHLLYDSSRGGGKFLRSATSGAENTGNYGITAFNTDGFRTNAYTYTNENTHTYVAWQWKANGGTTASNSVGDISSTVQANTDAGFSIVTYTGNGSQDQTIGHGLGAVPKMILFKNRSNTAYWYVYHIETGNDTMTYLNLSNAAQSLSSQFSTPTTTTFNVSNENSTFNGYNSSGQTYVAYVFADVQGYSKFGKYTGNGSADGTFVYTGFKPAFVLVKSSSATHNWHILDNKRDPENVVDKYVNPDNDVAEATFTFGDFLSNGFKWRSSSGTSFNENGTSYIYMAFAENPFVTSSGVPCTAR